MTKNAWLYFISRESVARANNPIVIPMFHEMGFKLCSYNLYLAKKKLIKDDTIIEIEGGPSEELPPPSEPDHNL